MLECDPALSTAGIVSECAGVIRTLCRRFQGGRLLECGATPAYWNGSVYPNAVRAALGGGVKGPFLRERGGAVRHDPAMPGIDIAMRGSANYNVTIFQQHTRTLIFEVMTKADGRAIAVRCGSWHGCLYQYRTAEFLSLGHDVNGMQILDQAGIDL